MFERAFGRNARPLCLRQWAVKLARAAGLAVTLSAACLGATGQAAGGKEPRFKAVAFDYFVIFDPNSVVPEIEKAFPGKSQEFVKIWRGKQFEYGFLRTITDRYADFFQVTDDALLYAAQAMKLDLTPQAHEQLLNAYLKLKPWPDAVAGLQQLKAAGVRLITLANFSPKMLRANADGANITALFDDLLSTDAQRTYKPDARAYQLGIDRLKLKKEEILFAAFGGWDAYGAKAFGYPTYWVNRFDQPVEQLPVRPDGISNSMQGLLDFVLGKS
jgi:2-haloacid dehalogenase